jgi:thiosulfate reductase cytochrome b subunit
MPRPLDFARGRHGLIVRVTHWINAIGTLALIVSGVAILLAHPRLYWGETGAVGTDSLIDLPIPFVFGHSGWGRYLHFLAAWVCVGSGALYLLAGVVTRHFGRDLVPSRADLTWSNIRRTMSDHLHLNLSDDDRRRSYNVLQRISYISVVFLGGPIVLASGLAFSPMLASASPTLVNVFGGQQSARTIHFFAAAGVVLFVIMHVTMVSLTGFIARVRAMITGDVDPMTEGS